MFSKYNSIENSYRDKMIARIVSHHLNKATWCVQEKVHGSNFSFIWDKGAVKIAKRTGLIGNPYQFNRSDVLLDKYQDKIKLLCSENFPNSTVNIYGEIFGGDYPNIKSEYRKIQKGVYYTPDVEFYGFDIKVDGKYLNVLECEELFQKYGVFYAQRLFTGTFDECMKYPNEFNSTIPSLLGLPDIGENICEGVVLRPLVTSYIGQARAILKNKNIKFSENSRGEKVKPIKNISEKMQSLLHNLQGYVNQNRLNNVLSKEEYDLPKMMGKLIADFSKDVMEDFVKDYPEINNLEESENKLLRKTLGSFNANLIKKYLNEK